MAVLNYEDLLGKVKLVLGDNMSDDALGLLEDLSDTYSANNSAAEVEKIRKEKEDLDTMWRKRYMDRFYSGEAIQTGGEVFNSGNNETIITESEEVYDEEDVDIFE